MAVYNKTVTSQLQIWASVIGETILALDAYGSLSAAEIYFDNRLNSSTWGDAELDNKKAALVEATRLIDTLNYNGDKTDSTQLHEFPRNDETTVPRNIELATYEIALKLLDGFDPDYEVENIAAVSRGYGGAKTTYDRSFAQEHTLAGIPSFRAWGFIKPYLRDPWEITISRAN